MSEENNKPLYWQTDVATHFRPNTGEQVIEREFDGDVPKDVNRSRFWGVGTLMIQLQTSQGIMNRPHHFDFPIKAKNVHEAFMRSNATFREAAKKEEDKLKRVQEQARNQLVVPANAGDIKGLRAS